MNSFLLELSTFFWNRGNEGNYTVPEQTQAVRVCVAEIGLRRDIIITDLAVLDPWSRIFSAPVIRLSTW
jgi:hypothetical protein